MEKQIDTIKIFLGVVSVAIIYFIIDKILTDRKNAKEQKEKEKAEKARKEELKKEGENASYSDLWYKDKADVVYATMNGDAVDEAPNSDTYNVFSSLKNEYDYIKLNEAYGVRPLYGVFGFKEGDFNLTQALSHEGLYNKCKDILSKKGINI